MKKYEVIEEILGSALTAPSRGEKGLAFAPVNIALCKYWGKRDAELNLPMTSSLSVALPDRGALTRIAFHDQSFDTVTLNDQLLAADSLFVKRLSEFLDAFRLRADWHLSVHIKMNVPVAAGLASSACSFASLVLAMKDLFSWTLSFRELSILARMGSGSAARSFWNGFVEWHAGLQANGMDSYAEHLAVEWPGLQMGILPINLGEKPLSSRQAMQQTIASCALYESWPKKAAHDLALLKQAIHSQNFHLLGGTAESNALTMHATMLSSWPPICYFSPETLIAMRKIWDLRQQGLSLYFTQDTGPDLKLLFMENDKETVQTHFPELDSIKLFES